MKKQKQFTFALTLLVLVSCQASKAPVSQAEKAKAFNLLKQDFIGHFQPIAPIKQGALATPFGPLTDESGNLVLFEGQQWKPVSDAEGEVVAVADGRVSEVGDDPEDGPYIEVQHSETVKSRYYFSDSSQIPVGKIVKRGESLGTLKNAKRKTLFLQIYVLDSGHWSYVDPIGFGLGADS